LIATSAKAKACLRDHEPIDEREIVEALRAKGHSSVALDRLSNSIDKREERASQRSEIARLNKQGWPDQRIAKKLGLSRPYICNLRKVMGIAPVPPSKRRR
jgi:DNA-binding NarL/FixJ family response regulator